MPLGFYVIVQILENYLKSSQASLNKTTTKTKSILEEVFSKKDTLMI